MVCRRGYPTNGPGDSCSGFVRSYHFASYGDNGEYQFDETRQDMPINCITGETVDSSIYIFMMKVCDFK